MWGTEKQPSRVSRVCLWNVSILAGELGKIGLICFFLDYVYLLDPLFQKQATCCICCLPPSSAEESFLCWWQIGHYRFLSVARKLETRTCSLWKRPYLKTGAFVVLPLATAVSVRYSILLHCFCDTWRPVVLPWEYSVGRPFEKGLRPSGGFTPATGGTKQLSK